MVQVENDQNQNEQNSCQKMANIQDSYLGSLKNESNAYRKLMSQVQGTSMFQRHKIGSVLGRKLLEAAASVSPQLGRSGLSTVIPLVVASFFFKGRHPT